MTGILEVSIHARVPMKKDHRGYDSQFTGEVGVGDGLAFVDRALMRKEGGWMLVKERHVHGLPSVTALPLPFCRVW